MSLLQFSTAMTIKVLNQRIGKIAIVVSMVSLCFTISTVYLSIEMGGVAHAVFVGWLCVVFFAVGAGLSCISIVTGRKIPGFIGVVISAIHLPFFAAFRHVL
ncbi:hypothetical protein AB833_28600 [Chromatiales bacterium (ex Bugula neritina AB1)]|nr:hypothetical protein AB833_28600 [Chromatiales bacterium (ex Bugula neritina AB1)]